MLKNGRVRKCHADMLRESANPKGKPAPATSPAEKRINRWPPGPASARAKATRRLPTQPPKENAKPASAAAGAQRAMAKMSATEQRAAPAQAQEDKARPA